MATSVVVTVFYGAQWSKTLKRRKEKWNQYGFKVFHYEKKL